MTDAQITDLMQCVETPIRDEHGRVIVVNGQHLFPHCPECGGLMRTVGRRSASRCGGQKGEQAPLYRCALCPYRSALCGDWSGDARVAVWNAESPETASTLR